MADPVIRKRPVVLRLAELQKYPTLEDRYAATLPFKGGAADCDCLWNSSEFMNCCGITSPSVRAKCIKRTAERWAWFSSARRLDDTYGKRLGTLNYLPWEIRQIIMELLFHGGYCYLGVYFIVNLISDIETPWKRYYTHRYNHREPYDGLWLASPSTKSEMDYYYFTNTTFIFRSPCYLRALADQLSTCEWSLLRSITLQLRHDDLLRDWESACAHLPPDLVSIQFNVHRWEIMRGAKIDGQWFIIPKGNNISPVEMFDQAVILVNTLGKLIHRVAAKAEIGLIVDSTEPEDEKWDELTNTHHRVLDDLDP